MNQRIKEVRKSYGLNQEKFGEKLGVTKTAVSKMELGTYNVTDTMAKLICSEYNVNYDWLVTGKGEMFREDDFAYDLGRYAANATDFEKDFITSFMKLPDSTKENIKKLMIEMTKNLKDND